MATCHMSWPNKTDIPLHIGLWSSMEELQNYIFELGMREEMYEEKFEIPDLEMADPMA